MRGHLRNQCVLFVLFHYRVVLRLAAINEAVFTYLSDILAIHQTKISFHKLQYIVTYKVPILQLPNVPITWNFMLLV